ncbi:hypothetical protein CKO31_09240 [Thiohalocapsa halophila]|uniref:Uncharacterized protein n=1 Tax=Thiohalocapsa halophila TaxID=69359 RepID=A0ABS1CG75_9GAMM|nr:hypothetical protein [Thiohalocapsa halophila]MBK1630922.1 hypothetical protein [Thiohalocapsa halophila]
MPESDVLIFDIIALEWAIGLLLLARLPLPTRMPREVRTDARRPDNEALTARGASGFVPQPDLARVLESLVPVPSS